MVDGRHVDGKIEGRTAARKCRQGDSRAGRNKKRNEILNEEDAAD